MKKALLILISFLLLSSIELQAMFTTLFKNRVTTLPTTTNLRMLPLPSSRHLVLSTLAYTGLRSPSFFKREASTIESCPDDKYEEYVSRLKALKDLPCLPFKDLGNGNQLTHLAAEKGDKRTCTRLIG